MSDPLAPSTPENSGALIDLQEDVFFGTVLVKSSRGVMYPFPVVLDMDGRKMLELYPSLVLVGKSSSGQDVFRDTSLDGDGATTGGAT